MGYRSKDDQFRANNRDDSNLPPRHRNAQFDNVNFDKASSRDDTYRSDAYTRDDVYARPSGNPYGNTDHGYNNRTYPDRLPENRYSGNPSERDRFGAQDHEHNDRFAAQGSDYALNDYRPSRNRGQRGNNTRDFSAPFEPHIDTPDYFTGANGGQVWEREPSFRNSSNTMDHPHDPDYWNWRNAELKRHDNAYSDWRRAQAETYDTSYSEWRKSRRDQFHKDFSDWRANQSQNAAAAKASDAQVSKTSAQASVSRWDDEGGALRDGAQADKSKSPTK